MTAYANSRSHDTRLFRRVWLAAALSAIGDGAYALAAPLLALQLTHRAFLVGVVAASETLPWLLLGPVSGAVVDRLDRRTLLVSVNAARAVVLSALSVAAATGTLTVALLVLGALLIGAGSTVVDTASQAILPAIVGTELLPLTRANGRVGAAITTGERFTGPLVGAALFTVGHSIPLLLDAVSFALSALLLSGLPPLETSRCTTLDQQRSRGQLWWADLRDGVGLLIGDRTLRALAVAAGLANLGLEASVGLLAVFAVRTLQLPGWGLALLLAASAVGSILGGLWAAFLTLCLGLRRTILMALFAGASALLLIAALQVAWVDATALFIVGWGVTTSGVSIQATRQASVPAHLLGRVVSTFRVVSLSGVVIGGLVGGTLIDAFGTRGPFLFAAGAFVLATVVAAAALVQAQ